MLDPPKDAQILPHRYIEGQITKLEAMLKSMGVNIHTLGFSFPGNTCPLRKKASTGRCEILSLDQVGLSSLPAMKVAVSREIGDIIPKNLANLPLYMGLESLPLMIFHLRRLGLNLSDIQI